MSLTCLLLFGRRFLAASPGTLSRSFSRSRSYVQGQSPEPRVREYFYYIDHQGQLFLDDTKVKNFITCFKDFQHPQYFAYVPGRTPLLFEIVPWDLLCPPERADGALGLSSHWKDWHLRQYGTPSVLHWRVSVDFVLKSLKWD